MAKKKTPTNEYVLTLQIGDKTYTASGASVYDALKKLEKPEKIVGKALLTLEHGELRSQQQFWPTRLKRLFYSPTFQAIQAKMLQSVGLKPIH